MTTDMEQLDHEILAAIHGFASDLARVRGTGRVVVQFDRVTFRETITEWTARGELPTRPSEEVWARARALEAAGYLQGIGGEAHQTPALTGTGLLRLEALRRTAATRQQECGCAGIPARRPHFLCVPTSECPEQAAPDGLIFVPAVGSDPAGLVERRSGTRWFNLYQHPSARR
jgi:hypothetical protein